MQRHTLPLRPLLGTLLLGLLLAGCDASRDDATALGPVPIASGDDRQGLAQRQPFQLGQAGSS
ncbi:hypothetical protein ACLBUU_16810, partial [Pseudomonas aeruginosa]